MDEPSPVVRGLIRHKPKEYVMSGTSNPSGHSQRVLTRRHFLAETGVAALGATLVQPLRARAAEGDKVKIGLIGCGGRGQWIIDLFDKNGGYQVVAAADYFEDRAGKVGDKFNIPAKNRFSGLGGYRRLLELDLDAVVIQTPPYHPSKRSRSGRGEACLPGKTVSRRCSRLPKHRS